MAEISTTYQSKVGREQGGDRFYMKEDGEFKFYDTDWDGKALRNVLASLYGFTAFGASGVFVSGPVNMSIYYGTVRYSLPTGISLASLHFPSAWKGARLRLDCFSMVTDANVIFRASVNSGTTGFSLIGKDGVVLSSINMSAVGYAVLACYTENTWQIVESNDSATGVAAA